MFSIQVLFGGSGRGRKFFHVPFAVKPPTNTEKFGFLVFLHKVLTQNAAAGTTTSNGTGPLARTISATPCRAHSITRIRRA
jgi:hypothetical protein